MKLRNGLTGTKGTRELMRHKLLIVKSNKTFMVVALSDPFTLFLFQ